LPNKFHIFLQDNFYTVYEHILKHFTPFSYVFFYQNDVGQTTTYVINSVIFENLMQYKIRKFYSGVSL